MDNDACTSERSGEFVVLDIQHAGHLPGLNQDSVFSETDLMEQPVDRPVEQFIEAFSEQTVVLSVEVLYKEYYTPLCLYAFDLLHDEDLAGDVVSALFLKVCEQKDKIIIHSSVRAYLHRSTYNSCMNVLRKKRYETHYRDYYLKFDTSSHSHDYGSLSFPLSGIIENELIGDLEAIIARFPAQLRRVFLLSRVDGLSHKEIAERLSISVNTVKSQVTIALARIHKEMRSITLSLATLTIAGFI